MKRTRTPQSSIDAFLTLQPGQEFIDHGGIRVRKIEDVAVALSKLADGMKGYGVHYNWTLGAGYNSTLTIADYVGRVRSGYYWGSYLLPENPHFA